ncbi:MAG: DUF1648 domain-containing protein [Microbacteriaceae bacterium]|nr:DUF1648 domain-containing protein [Microbacteriaceae bacterium]
MTRLPFRIAVVSLIAPLLCVAAGVALQLAWLPRLPETIAVHWDFGGGPDGFGPAWSMPLALGIVGAGIASLFSAMVGHSLAPDGPTRTQKLLAAASLFAGAYLSFAFTATVGIQLLPEAEQPHIAAMLGIGALAGLALAAVGWFVMPRAIHGRSATAGPVAPVAVAPGERVVWIGRTRFPGAVMVALVGSIVLATGAITFGIAASGMWWLAIVPVALVAAVLSTSSWTVRVDESGFTVRSALGWPRHRVPIERVEGAGVTTIVPMGEFGGYGMRVGLDGRLGVITRAGEALEVRRTDGRAVVVTVDDAATAAGLLTAYAAGRAG